MTSGQRVRAALEHRTPDRTPIFEYVMHSAVAEKFLGRPCATDDAVFQATIRESGYEAALRQMAKDQLDLAELFGFDMLYVCPIPTGLPNPSAPPPPPAGEDPVENLRARVEADRQRKATGLRDVILAQFVAVQEEIRRRSLDLPMLVPAYGHGVWTDVDLMQTMLLAPEVAHEHFALRTRSVLAVVEQFLAMGIDQIGVGGDFAGNRPIISADAYRRFIVPEVRKVVERVHLGHAYAVNASDGDLWYVIDDFLTGCDVDGYIEIDGQAGMDLRRLKERFGRRVTLYGNFDCMQVLCFASPQEVRRHARATIEAGLGDGGHILCANNAITSAVPVANYVALQQAYREYFGMPGLKGLS
jgi:uroporphyrinogen decarboxylase